MGKTTNPDMYSPLGLLSELRPLSPSRMVTTPRLLYVPDHVADNLVPANKGVMQQVSAAFTAPLSAVSFSRSEALDLEVKLLSDGPTQEPSPYTFSNHLLDPMEIVHLHGSVHGGLPDKERMEHPLEVVVCEKFKRTTRSGAKAYVDVFYVNASYVYDPLLETWILSGRYGKRCAPGVPTSGSEPYKQLARAKKKADIDLEVLAATRNSARKKLTPQTQVSCLTADDVRKLKS